MAFDYIRGAGERGSQGAGSPPGVGPGVGTVPTGVVGAATPAANVLKLA